MSTHLPEYMVERLRRPAPTDAHVVSGSTPVVSFGNAAKAVVATVGLNPSRQEFLDKYGAELSEGSQRFETLASLGVSTLATAPESLLRRVVQRCTDYFAGNPYRRWFDQLDDVLQRVDYSYYDGSACHLDLVQWATDPVWSKIPSRAVRERLIAQDSEFLRCQLHQGSFKMVLINGTGVARQFESVIGMSLRPVSSVAGASASSRLSVGTLSSGTRVVAWSVNIQSSFGVCNALRASLADRVAELINDGASA